jgi:hypothetical protein
VSDFVLLQVTATSSNTRAVPSHSRRTLNAATVLLTTLQAIQVFVPELLDSDSGTFFRKCDWYGHCRHSMIVSRTRTEILNRHVNVSVGN